RETDFVVGLDGAVEAWVREGGGEWLEKYVWDGMTTEGDLKRLVGGGKVDVDGLVGIVRRGRGGERTAFKLLSVVAAEGGRVQEEVGDDEMDMICDLVEVGREGWGVEEREDLEDCVEEAVKVLPRGVREMMEEGEGGLSMGGGASGGGKGGLEGLVGRVMTWLLVCEWVEGAEKRGLVGGYVGATGIVERLLGGVIGKMIEEGWDGEGGGGGMGCMEYGRGGWKEEEVFELCLNGFTRALEVLPGLVREWWTGCGDRGVKEAVLAFVEKQASKVVLGKEMGKIVGAGRETLGEMNVKGSIVSGEITATYVQDEVELCVVVKAPKAFPLRNVEVDASRGGGSGGQGIRWGLMMNCSLQQGSGGILDALLLWKDNIEAEYEGVEPCPICYAILHPDTRSKPGLECKTCHNKFHKRCLVQWFQQKQTNACVICQQPIEIAHGKRGR
ncbi:hypothetical protein TrRE_jg12253, partial [Triparma retinervis]